jgi:hypothetical protein
MTFTTPIFSELTVPRLYSGKMFYTEFHSIAPRDMQNKNRSTFAPVSDVRIIVTEPVFTKLATV